MGTLSHGLAKLLFVYVLPISHGVINSTIYAAKTSVYLIYATFVHVLDKTNPRSFLQDKQNITETST